MRLYILPILFFACVCGVSANQRHSMNKFLRVQIEMAGRDTTLCWEADGRRVRRGWRVEECTDLGRACRNDGRSMCDCIQSTVDCQANNIRRCPKAFRQDFCQNTRYVASFFICDDVQC